MKKTLLIIIISMCLIPVLKSQYITKDTTLANEYYKTSYKFLKNYELDSALDYVTKAQTLYVKYLGEKCMKNANCYNILGIVYYYASMYDQSLENYFKSLELKKELLGENNIYVAMSYNNIGAVFAEKSDIEKALEYYQKSLSIYKLINGEKSTNVADLYNNIGNIYKNKSDYNKALEYLIKGLKLRQELLGENNSAVADSYLNIGIVYKYKSEYDKALEYYFKSLEIFKKNNGEKSRDVADVYNNIGNIYSEKSDYDKALVFLTKSLEIKKELFDEKSTSLATSYINIGDIYTQNLEYDKALEYYFKSLKIFTELFGQESAYVADNYFSIGIVYTYKSKYKEGEEYLFKSLQISKVVFGEKSSDVAQTLLNLGYINDYKTDYDKALKYYQKSMASCLRYFNDTTNVFLVPEISNYLEWIDILNSLQSKAKILADTNKFLPNIANSQRIYLALQHYQATDTLIDQVRLNITYQDDKLSLMQQSHSIYSQAIDVCKTISTKVPADSVYFYKSLAFNYSEKSKIRILLDDIAQKNAELSAGIPDSLTQQEYELKCNISYYQNLIAENQDSSKTLDLSSKLFDARRKFEDFTNVLKTNYPEYAALSYNNSVPQLSDIQKNIAYNSAIISYTLSDSLLYSFFITNQNVEINKTILPATFYNDLATYLASLTNIDKSNNSNFIAQSQNLYKQLIPYDLPNNPNITNLLIIPDDSLSLLPFETLLTENYTGDLSSLKDCPFLIKKYSVTYSPSVTMWYNSQTEPQPDKRKDIALFAPVEFNKDSVVIAKTDDFFTADSTMMRGFTDNGYDKDLYFVAFFKPLLSSKQETDDIFKLFGKRRAEKFQYKGASEYSFKNSDLANFKIIHIATHAYSSPNEHLLSGILFANDTTGGEDGFLRESEIYNLKLNADLVTLSACETAEGEIFEGEGIMSLSRAFIYAGARNVIATQWSVFDITTAELMKNFYKYYLTKKYSFAQALQLAKIDMISKGGQYSHPKVWAPFVLIGQ